MSYEKLSEMNKANFKSNRKENYDLANVIKL